MLGVSLQRQMLRESGTGASEMAQWGKVLDSKDLSSVLRPHTVQGEN